MAVPGKNKCISMAWLCTCQHLCGGRCWVDGDEILGRMGLFSLSVFLNLGFLSLDIDT